MKIKSVVIRGVVALVFPMIDSFSIARAEEQASPVPPEVAPIQSTRPILFTGLKFWAAKWDTPYMDAQVVLPGPVVKTGPRQTTSDLAIVPILTAGVLYDKFTLSSSYFAPTDFSFGDNLTPTGSRKEWDVTLGYALFPNLTASIAYRSGTVDGGATTNLNALGVFRSRYKVDGWLLGLSGSAPLQDRLSLYGNFAYGIIKNKLNSTQLLGSPTYNGTYTIGEVGLAYRLMDESGSGFIRSLTAQLGYRAQIVFIPGFEYPIYSIPPGVARLSTDKVDVRATTSGVMLGIVAAF